MNKGILRPGVLLALLGLLSGCATPSAGNAILSAADAETMINIKVAATEPAPPTVLLAERR